MKQPNWAIGMRVVNGDGDHGALMSIRRVWLDVQWDEKAGKPGIRKVYHSADGWIRPEGPC